MDGDLLDGSLLAVSVDLHHGDRVRVHLVEVDLDRAAAVPRLLIPFDELRVMNMAQGEVIVVVPQRVDLHVIHATHRLLVVPFSVRPAEGEVPHHDDRHILFVLSSDDFLRRVEQSHLALPDVGDGDDVGDGCSAFPLNGNDMFFFDGFVVFIFFGVTDHLHVRQLPELVGRLQSGVTVMVAGGDDDGHGWACFVDGHHAVGVELLRRGGRNGGVVDVSADQQCVGLLPLHDGTQLVEEAAVLLLTVISVEILPDVPVRCVYESHGEMLFI